MALLALIYAFVTLLWFIDALNEYFDYIEQTTISYKIPLSILIVPLLFILAVSWLPLLILSLFVKL